MSPRRILQPLKRRRALADGSAVVAAVCYRKRNGRLRFLLVRTKDGTRWTFPKGHVKQKEEKERTKWDEEPSQAAAREAEEEAGVRGLVDSDPFTHYLYRGAKGEKKDRVGAYLLKVEEENEPAPGEEIREPSWFTPREARQRLASGRREKYAEEHERVLELAVRELEAREG